MRTRYRQDLVTGKLIEISNERTKSVAPSIRVTESYRSPVDGSMIRNKRNGVSNDRDSLNEQVQRSQNRDHTISDSKERKAEIRDAIERASSSGYHRNTQYAHD
mgnify:CR=1 FL=1